MRHCFGLVSLLVGSLLWASAADAAACAPVATFAVNQAGGPFTTISSAVASIPSSLTEDVCVDIQDGAVYVESVTIQGISNNGFRISIGALQNEPAPTIEPPAGSTAAVQIFVSSVSLLNMNIRFNHLVTYGVQVSSDYASLDRVFLSDQGQFVGTYGVFLQANWGSVAQSTISISGAVPAPEAETLGGTIGSIPVAVYLLRASSNTIRQTYIESVFGMGVYSDDSDYNEIAASTVNGGTSLAFVDAAIGCPTACVYTYDSMVIDENSNSNLITGSYLNGFGADIFGSGNTIAASTVALRYDPSLFYSCAPSYAASPPPLCQGKYYYLASGSQFIYGLTIDAGAANNSITRSYSDHGVNLTGDQNSSLANSTVTIFVPGFAALFLQGSSSDSVVQSYALGGIGVEIQGSTGTTISAATLADPFASGEAVWFTQGSSSLTLAADAVVGGRYGLLLDAPGAGPGVVVSGLTFSALSPGATAIDFGGGVVVATFSGVSFDASVSANVSAAALSPGSRVTMLAHSGAHDGPAYENDPSGDVSWNWPSRLIASSVPAAGYISINQIFTAAATLVDGVSSAPIAGAALAFYFGSSSAAATTDALGQAAAAFNSGLLFGTTVYGVAFAGNAPYAASAGSATVNAAPAVLSLSTPSFPSGGIFISTPDPVFTWQGPSTATVADLGGGASFYLQLSSGDPAFSASRILWTAVIPMAVDSASATADGAYASNVALAGGGIYYWRVATLYPLYGASAWSLTASFRTDEQPPVASRFVSFSSTGGALGEAQVGVLLSGVTVQITLQDSLSGLAAGDSVSYSTDAGRSWIAVATAALSGALGATTPQTLTAYGLNLAESTSAAVCAGAAPCGATDQVKFTAADAAGNTATEGPYAVLVDTVGPTSAIATPPSGTVVSALSAFAGTSAGFIGVSTVALSLQDAGSAAPNCYSPAAENFSSPCPAWFAAQGATAAWTYALAVPPWTDGHSYILFSSAADVAGRAQTTASSSAFTFQNSTPTVYYAGVDASPPSAVQGGKAALIRFTLSSPQPGISLTSVTVSLIGTAPDADVAEVFIYRGSGFSAFDPAQDALIGAGTMRAGVSTVTLAVPTLLVPGQPQAFFAVYSVASAANVGDTLGAVVAAPQNVGLSPPVVPTGSFPTASRLVPVAGAPGPPGVTSVSSFPNPVDTRQGPATIAFTLPGSSDVDIRIMTLYGSKVREFHAAGSAGRNTASWDGNDSAGRKVGMGVYIAVIDAAGSRAMYKIAVLH